jgi:hypothetical protein
MGVAKKVSGALGGKGPMMALAERQQIIAWIEETHAAGASLWFVGDRLAPITTVATIG